MSRSAHAALLGTAGLCASLALAFASWPVRPDRAAPGSVGCVTRRPPGGGVVQAASARASLAEVIPQPSSQREELGIQSAATEDPTPAAPKRAFRIPDRRIEGRVVDLDGAPVVGIGIATAASSERESQARSGADGRFSFSAAAHSARLFSTAADHVVVASTRVRADQDAIVVVAPTSRLSIEILDARTGLPLRAASIHPTPTVSLGIRLQALSEQYPGLSGIPASALVGQGVSTNAQGFAQLPLFPGGDSCKLQLTRPGYAPLTLGPELDGDPYVTARMRPLAPDVRLTGLVTDEAGDPVAFAEVRHRDTAARTDESGSFVLMLETPPTVPLKVLHPRAGVALVDPAEAAAGSMTVVLRPEVRESKAVASAP